jgi:hypothetical protein
MAVFDVGNNLTRFMAGGVAAAAKQKAESIKEITLDLVEFTSLIKLHPLVSSWRKDIPFPCLPAIHLALLIIS